MVRQHQIGFKSNLERLGMLVIERLIDSAYATIQNSFHCSACVPARVSPARGPVRRCLPGVCGRKSQGLCSAPKALPLRAYD
jgi:hypothetical protein